VLGGALYLTATLAGYVVELLFNWFGWIPARASAHLPTGGVSWDYTSWLNILFLVLAGLLVFRFVRTGGLPMLRMMGGSPDADHDHGGDHEHNHDHGHADGSGHGEQEEQHHHH
jgi:uncharacterized protein